MYKQDSNNDMKQVPNSPNFSESPAAYNRATNPPSETIQDRPNFVIVNKAGTYGFL